MFFYSIYRWALFGITIFNIYNVILSALEYKRYYDQLPLGLRRYLQDKTVRILGDKISKSHKELWQNLGLLVVLILLNIVLFII
ncbi:MAG: hypothetical protein HC799_04465 [Limnothrix sp. RL_2_0]|nr:hypothetical protein [Limnothrix sp. RL_2_0]